MTSMALRTRSLTLAARVCHLSYITCARCVVGGAGKVVTHTGVPSTATVLEERLPRALQQRIPVGVLSGASIYTVCPVDAPGDDVMEGSKTQTDDQGHDSNEKVASFIDLTTTDEGTSDPAIVTTDTDTADAHQNSETRLDTHGSPSTNVMNPFDDESGSPKLTASGDYNEDKNPFETNTEMAKMVKNSDSDTKRENPVNPFEPEFEKDNEKHESGNPFEAETKISISPFSVSHTNEQTKSDSLRNSSGDDVIPQDENNQHSNPDSTPQVIQTDSGSGPSSTVCDNLTLSDTPVLPVTSIQQSTLSHGYPLSRDDSTSSNNRQDFNLNPSHNPTTQYSTVPEQPAILSSTTESGGGDVVVVTGGSGFLGQHIVKLLQMKAPHVKEIRVIDQVPFTQRLDYEATKPVKICTGSITDPDFVMSSIAGATSVLHIAGLVSYGTFPDFDGMQRVNVNGTVNVVNACMHQGVSRLVYCSTVDVVVGDDPIRGGDEENTHVPRHFLFPGYPETKYHGERVVLGASQCPRKLAPPLQTLSLRANVMYGELDPFYVTSGLRMANQRGGTLHQVGNGRAMFQQSYVGNTAWAFVCADRAMAHSPELTSRFFYVPDNTPIQNTFNFMRPYLEARGFQLSNGSLPYSLAYGAIFVSEKLAKLISPLKKLSLPAQSYSITYINMDIFFRADKAKQLLKYEPLFTPVDARIQSMDYYKEVEL